MARLEKKMFKEGCLVYLLLYQELNTAFSKPGQQQSRFIQSDQSRAGQGRAGLSVRPGAAETNCRLKQRLEPRPVLRETSSPVIPSRTESACTDPLNKSQYPGKQVNKTAQNKNQDIKM